MSGIALIIVFVICFASGFVWGYFKDKSLKNNNLRR